MLLSANLYVPFVAFVHTFCRICLVSSNVSAVISNFVRTLCSLSFHQLYLVLLSAYLYLTNYINYVLYHKNNAGRNDWLTIRFEYPAVVPTRENPTRWRRHMVTVKLSAPQEPIWWFIFSTLHCSWCRAENTLLSSVVISSCIVSASSSLWLK